MGTIAENSWPPRPERRLVVRPFKNTLCHWPGIRGRIAPLLPARLGSTGFALEGRRSLTYPVGSWSFFALLQSGANRAPARDNGGGKRSNGGKIEPNWPAWRCGAPGEGLPALIPGRSSVVGRG